MGVPVSREQLVEPVGEDRLVEEEEEEQRQELVVSTFSPMWTW